ncbi:oligonucleotide/oligosaccharide-binding (OB)-fold family protein, partial [Vibrio parahaemolyticus V-223/04]
CRF